MNELLVSLSELKPGDYFFLVLDFLVVLLVIILVIRSIKRSRKIKKDEHLEELLITEEKDTPEEIINVEVNEAQEEVKEESQEEIHEEIREVKEDNEMVVKEIQKEEKEAPKVSENEKPKKVTVKRKEPVKIERVENLTTEEYTSESEFELVRVLLPNKVEYNLGKGWENTFKRARRNEEFKNNLWPFIYNSYQENKEVTPALNDLFKPFEYCDPSHTKVVFINKQPGLTVKEDGLAFSTKEIAKKTPLFDELYQNARLDRNIRAIRYDDGNLENWAKQGVFLYNYILLNVQGETKKHENAGYEVFSNMVIKDLVKDSNPKVFVVFTNYVYSNFMNVLGNNSNHKVIFISSPSKIKDSNLFSEINDFLISKNIEPINWSLGKIRK